MSGTSADGIDAALVEIDVATGQPKLVRSLEFALSTQLKQRIENAIRGDNLSLDEALQLDLDLGEAFAEATLTLLNGDHADAIGSHGQTVLHCPKKGYSLQLGAGAVIAERTGITTVTDFRSRDLALGGQGAPLAPALHQALFRSPAESRVVANIGGIANITLLPPDKDATIIGFDSGPGNTLLDAWCRRHFGASYDQNGEIARRGKIDANLLERLLSDAYFALEPPKSTGREYFHAVWLDRNLENTDLAPIDVQATLAELSARTITDAIAAHSQDADALYVCGGGAHNGHLLDRLAHHFDGSVQTTEKIGLDPDWVEAIAFAWLSFRTLNGLNGNLPDVTGASRPTVLGCVWPQGID